MNHISLYQNASTQQRLIQSPLITSQTSPTLFLSHCLGLDLIYSLVFFKLQRYSSAGLDKCQNLLLFYYIFVKPRPKTQPPKTFRRSGWDYMVQVEALSTPECQEGVPSEGGHQREEQG